MSQVAQRYSPPIIQTRVESRCPRPSSFSNFKAQKKHPIHQWSIEMYHHRHWNLSDWRNFGLIWPTDLQTIGKTAISKSNPVKFNHILKLPPRSWSWRRGTFKLTNQVPFYSNGGLSSLKIHEDARPNAKFYRGLNVAVSTTPVQLHSSSILVKWYLHSLLYVSW